MPLDRTSVFLHGTYDFSTTTQGYLQSLYSDYSVSRQLAPVDAGVLLVPPTNPYVPADLKTLLDSRAFPDDPVSLHTGRISAIGPRVSRNDRQLLQLTSGIKGRVLEDWNYDAYIQWGSNDRDEHQTGNVSISRFQDLVFAPDGGQVDLRRVQSRSWSALISSDCARYISLSGSHKITVRQTLAEASMNGPLLRDAGREPARRVRRRSTGARIFDFKPERLAEQDAAGGPRRHRCPAGHHRISRRAGARRAARATRTVYVEMHSRRSRAM